MEFDSEIHEELANKFRAFLKLKNYKRGMAGLLGEMGVGGKCFSFSYFLIACFHYIL